MYCIMSTNMGIFGELQKLKERMCPLNVRGKWDSCNKPLHNALVVILSGSLVTQNDTWCSLATSPLSLSSDSQGWPHSRGQSWCT